MPHLSSEHRIYNTLSTDFKVEAVAANILKYYDEDASIFLKRVGINDRPYLKDVKRIYSAPVELQEVATIIETYRESIYDYLPEALFHPPSLGVPVQNVDSAVKQIRRQKKIEEDARKFFQPFELEFFYTEVSALLKEAEFDTNDPSNALVATLGQLWPLLEKVDFDTAKTLFAILPSVHEIRGNRELIERFISAFVNAETTISFVPNTIDESDDAEGLARLGQTKLGLTLIPNGKHQDGLRNWQINIGPLGYGEIVKFLDGHPFRKLLEEVYDYLMPLSVKITTRILTERQEEAFSLNDSSASRLGYSTFI